MILDLFAGPGGWDIAARDIGLDVIGIEFDPSACETRRAAGLKTIEGDVRDYSPADFRYPEGLIASPPCPTFSAAGSGSGRAELEMLRERIAEMAQTFYEWNLPETGWTPRRHLDALATEGFSDERTALTLQPLRFIIEALADGHPFKWITFEQVPPALPAWEAYAEVLRSLGYSVATGNVQAEQYGVPQTRKRAILIAKLHSTATLPAPTHSRYHPRNPSRLDPGVLPWVSMAQALNFGLSDRPSPTVTAGGTETGGAEPIANLARYVSRPDWTMRSNYGTSGDAANRGERPTTAPAPTITSKINRNKWMGDVRSSKGTVRAVGTPAPTLTSAMDNGNFRWMPESDRVSVREAAVLQSFPSDHPWRGTKTKQYQQVGNAIPPLLARAILKEVV